MSIQPPPTVAALHKDQGLSVREYVGYALGDTASNLFFATFNIFLIYYYVDVWAIPAASILFGALDRSTVFLSSGMLAQILGTAVLGCIVRRVDKKRAPWPLPKVELSESRGGQKAAHFLISPSLTCAFAYSIYDVNNLPVIKCVFLWCLGFEVTGRFDFGRGRAPGFAHLELRLGVPPSAKVAAV